MKELQKIFKNLLKLETKARDIYSEILKENSGREVNKSISIIKNQEIGHMNLAKVLIELSKKAEQRKFKPRINKKDLNILKRDIILKKALLDALHKFINTKLEDFALVDLLGKKYVYFQKIDELKKEFIRSVTHQLKTPLTTTNFISELLLIDKKEKLTKRQKEMITELKAANKSMVSLIDDLLEVSRIEESKKKFKIESVDLTELVKGLVKELNYLIKSNNQKFNLGILGAKVLVLSNANILGKIIFNLLTNAARYGKKGGKISVKVVKQKDGKIILSISDDGIGIPKKEQRNIFSKFFRASNAVRVESSGTGLGLYIVKELLKIVKGKIWFESEENKGTTFFLLLPAARD